MTNLQLKAFLVIYNVHCLSVVECLLRQLWCLHVSTGMKHTGTEIASGEIS